MKIRAFALLAALSLFSATALARHCPADMKKIDEALAKKPTLTDAQAADVKKWRAEGEELHKAGKHPEAEASLAKAMEVLKVK